MRAKLQPTPSAADGSVAPAKPQARRPDAIRVQLSDFELGRVLGEGNYSRVFLATWRSTGEKVAVKLIEKKKVERFKKQAEPLMEKHVLSITSHPSIVRLLHTFHDSACLYIVTEYVPGGELWNLTHRTGVRHSLGAFYAAELLDVLEYLHANSVRASPPPPPPRAARLARACRRRLNLAIFRASLRARRSSTATLSPKTCSLVRTGTSS